MATFVAQAAHQRGNILGFQNQCKVRVNEKAFGEAVSAVQQEIVGEREWLIKKLHEIDTALGEMGVNARQRHYRAAQKNKAPRNATCTLLEILANKSLTKEEIV